MATPADLPPGTPDAPKAGPGGQWWTPGASMFLLLATLATIASYPTIPFANTIVVAGVLLAALAPGVSRQGGRRTSAHVPAARAR